MSTTVDNRVVEMQFDNKQFEANVKTTMSTLERLKQSLNLRGASKGLEEVQAAASKCDVSGLNNGLNEARNGFSALQVMGVTALATITNQAVHAGERMVKALTITPVTDGYREYETQMNAIQTILANTQKEGTNVATVNKYLDELNEYADKTIYNFTEMTRNIGTFTAAGVNLDTSVSAIKGIANLAAVSGSNSQQASTAMYQLSQALASGTVKLQDWNSVVNAGMGGQVFQDALTRTSELLETGAKAAIETRGSFRESLRDGWLTTEVLTQTLDMFATAAESEEEYAAAMEKFISQGYTEQQAKEMADMARTAGEAATKVKTFTQLLDTCKEALGSGWAQTWRLIFGDFEEARTLWTSVSDVFSGIINRFSEARNNLLESALGQTFQGLVETVTGALDPVMEMAEAVGDVTDTIIDLGAVVDDVIVGKFGNGQERFDALTEAGINYYRVQNEVNKKLNDGYRYTEAQIAAQDELLGAQQKSAEDTEAAASGTKKLTAAQKEQIKQLGKLSDEQLRSNGFTEEQIAALRELRDIAEQLNMPFDDFIDKLDEINGRWILIESFKNLGEAIASLFRAIGTAFSNVFDTVQPQQIFDLIMGFNGMTNALVPSQETLDKLTRAFTGLFSAIQLVSTIAGGALKIAFAVFSELLESAGLTVLDLIAIVGDMVTKFNDWFQDSIFVEVVDTIVEGIQTIIDAVKEFINQFQIDEKLAAGWESVANGLSSMYSIVKAKLPKMSWPTLINNVLKLFGTTTGDALIAISDFVVKVFEWLDANTLLIKGTSKIAEIVAALIEGVAGLVEKFMALEPVQEFIQSIADAFSKFFSNLGDIEVGTGALDTLLSVIENAFININKWLDTLGNSEHFGRDLVTGLVNGIISGIGMVVSAVIDLASSIIETVCGILGIHSPSTVMFGIGENVIQGLVNGLTSGLSWLWGLLTSIGSGIIERISGAGSTLYNAGYNLFTGFWNGISAAYDAIKNFISGMGKGIAEVFGKVDWGVVAAAGSGIAGFTLLWKFVGVLSKFADISAGIGGCLDALKKVIGGLEGVVGAIEDNIKAKTLLVKAEAIKTLAVAIGIVAASIWVLSKIEGGDLAKALAVIAGVAAVLGLLFFVLDHFTKWDPKNLVAGLANFVKLGMLFTSLGTALIAFAISMKILSTIDEASMQTAGRAIAGFGVILMALIAVTANAGRESQISAATKMIGKMALALLVAAAAAKLIASMTWGDLKKAGAGILAFGALAVILIAATRLMNKRKGIDKLPATMLAIAAAIGILALVSKLIASMSWSDMGKAAAGIAGFTLIVVGLIAATRLVAGKQLHSIGTTLIAIAAAIGILALVAKLLASTSWEEFKNGARAIAALGAIVILLVAATNLAGGNDLKGVAATLLSMAICIGILGGISVLLGLVDPATLWKGIGAVAALSALVALLTLSAKGVGDASKSITAMAIAIGVLAAAVVVLSFIDPKKLIAPVVAMSALMGMFALITYSSKNVTGAWTTVAAMAGVIAILAIALYHLSKLPAESLIASAESLTVLLLALSASLAILSHINPFTKAAIGTVYAMVGVVALLAIILGAMSALDVAPSLETAGALSLLLLALSGSVAILSLVGPAAAGATAGIMAMVEVVLVMGVLLAALGTLVELVPQAQTFLDSGIAVLESIGKAIGSFLGSIVGGLLDGATSTLPEVGTRLSEFMENLQPFLVGLKMVDESSVTAAETLAKVVLALSGAGLADAFTSFLTGGWLTGDSSFDSIAEKLSAFGRGMKAFADETAGINTEAIVNSASAAEALVAVANALPSDGGLWQVLAGQKDLGELGTQLVSFGYAMKSYATQVEGLNTEAITNSVPAAQAMVSVLESLPRDGGIWQAIIGEKDLSELGYQLVPFGYGMKSYADAVAGINTEAIVNSADAAEALVEVAKAVPKDGGLWQWLSGERDLSNLGEELAPFGNGMKAYATAVEGLSVSAITNSVKAVEAIVKVSESIPHENVYMRDKDVSLAEDLVPFAEGAKKYSAAVSGIDVGAINSSVTVGDKLVALIDKVSGTDTGGVSSFVSAINELGTVSFNNIVNAFSGAPEALASIGTAITTGLALGIQNGKAAVVVAVDAIINSVSTALSSEINSFSTAGTDMVTSFADGISGSTSAASAAVKSMATAAAGAASSSYATFYSAGRNCASGFASGISSGSYAATIAARAMANAAAQAAKNALDINSPSRVFMAIGQGVPEGFAKGIDKYGYYVANSIETMATDAFENTKSAISRIGNALDLADLDSNPTIRPVVDLSNVESGVSAINGMFGSNFALGAQLNLNAISATMHRNRQNGTNDDVVSAIDRLRKDVGNLENHSYSIGDVTYSSGSDVANAIETLVNAVRVEGRA